MISDRKRPKWILVVSGTTVVIGLIAGLVKLLASLNLLMASAPSLGPGTSEAPSPVAIAATAVAAPPTPSPIWTVNLNSVNHPTTYNGYSVTRAATHFIIINATIHNNSPDSQVLTGAVVSLKDSAGQTYPEDQASTPGATYTVPPGQSIVGEFAYVVPNAVCAYTLTVVLEDAAQDSWNITSHYPGCG